MATENIVCVKCTSVLDRTTIGGIEVDNCPQCGGLWLDRGELEQILDQTGAADPVARHLSDTFSADTERRSRESDKGA